MKRLLTLTLCLIATASPYAVQADPCDNLRNNQQAYRDCVNDWYGRSNRGNAPTPWWKNYDPNAGSNSAPAEAPTLSKQQLLDLQRQQQEADRQAAEEQRKRDHAKWEFDHARGRLDWLNQYGLEKLKPEDVLPAFNGGLEYLQKYGEGAFGTERACQLYENIGHALVRQGHMRDAEAWFKKSVAIKDDSGSRTKVDEYSVASYNRSLKALATFYERQGRLKEALDIQSRRFYTTQRSVFDHHPETIRAAEDYVRMQERLSRAQMNERSKKGLALYENGQYAEAVTEFRAVLGFEASMEHSTLRDVGAWDAARHNLGMSLLALKNYAEAETHFKAALAMRERYLVELSPKLLDYGPREISLRNRLNGLAELHELQQQYTQAEPYLRRIVELQEKTRAPAAVTMKSLNKLAFNLRQQQRYDEAEALYQRGLALAEARKGKDNEKDKDASEIAMDTRKYLADLQRQRGTSPAPAAQSGDWKTAWNTVSDEAVKLSADRKTSPTLAVEKAREALALAEKHDGSKKYAVASSQQLLAQMLWRNKQTDEAEALLKTAINTFEQGNESKTVPALAKTLTTLARLQASQKRGAEAEALYKRAIALREKQADQPALIESLTDLAGFYEIHDRRSAEYAPLMRRKLALQEKHVGPEHLDVAETLNSLAWHLYIEGMNSKGAQSTAHYTESETQYKRALAILEKSPSAKTKPLLLKVLYGLRKVYRMTDQEQAAAQIEQREKALEARG